MTRSKHANYRPLDNEFNPNCKLTDQQVEDIIRTYEKYGYSLRKLAKMFDISHRQVLRIIKCEQRKPR